MKSSMFSFFGCTRMAAATVWLLAVRGGAAETARPAMAVPAAGVPAAAVAEARHEIAALRETVAYHDRLYHQQAAPQISDYDYDQLKRRLRELERAFPDLAAEPGAVAEVGDDRTGLFATARHREKMLSLEKTYAEADVRAFDHRLAKRLGRDDLAYVVEPKFDGLAVSATFEDGQLVRAVTRGNGTEGDDITVNALAVRGFPRSLRATTGEGVENPVPSVIELRGEIFVSLAEFARVNGEREAAGEAAFANPRNLAAGTIRQLDPRVVAERNLDVVFYGVGACEPAAALPATQHELHAMLRRWGVPAVGNYWTARGGDELWSAVRELGRARAAFPFPTDGAVAKLDPVEAQRAVGVSADAPRWAIAYKFAPARVETRIRAIVVQVGRTGVLTPVAELEPVQVAGSTVARATLHNRDEIARRDVRVGDYVYLEKAGEIVPAIVGVDVARRPAGTVAFAFPAACPACGAPVASRPDEVALRCTNEACPERLRRRLEHFAGRECLGIEGVGPALIDACVTRGWLKELPDLYRLRREDLLTLGRDVARSMDRVLAAIERSKRAELWRVIHGLGIPQIGEASAKELARRFGSLDALRRISPGDNAAAVERAVGAWLAEPRHRAIVEGLIAAGVAPTGESRATARPLAGKVFVLTGTLPTLTRAQAIEKIEAAGGRVATGVGRNVDFVVAGAEAGAKLGQARTAGVRVIDEAELRRMLAAE
jgi:DNA ligase (NAD+)